MTCVQPDMFLECRGPHGPNTTSYGRNLRSFGRPSVGCHPWRFLFFPLRGKNSVKLRQSLPRKVLQLSLLEFEF
jgi:hypothetical protein